MSSFQVEDESSNLSSRTKQRYYVGNTLRGWFSFEADSDEDAAIKGPPIFNSYYPSDTGRFVHVIRVVDVFNGYTDPKSDVPVVSNRQVFFG